MRLRTRSCRAASCTMLTLGKGTRRLTPQTAPTSTILRRSYQYDQSPDEGGSIGGLSCATSRSAEKPAAAARIYVTNQLDNTVSVIDGATHKVVATVRVGVAPAQMAVSPDRRSVYIANTGSNTVSVLDTATNTIARTIALPRGSRPAGVAVDPRGRYLYTADGGSNRVSVLDTRSKRVVASVRVGTQPLSVAVAPDGKKIYAANSGSGDVSI